MAAAPFITQTVAQGLLTSLETSLNAGTAAVIQIYSGSVPADADAANGGTLLATLTCAASVFVSKTDGSPGAVGTFDTIAADVSADNTGTAAFFRISTQSGGTVCFQGTVGTSSADMIVNTTAFTAGSNVSCSAATITVPEG